MNNTWVIDIETKGNPAMIGFISEPKPVSQEDAPKNYRKEETILVWMERETKNREMKYQKQIRDMALDIDYARIVALGMCYEARDLVVFTADNEKEEFSILDNFWHVLSSYDTRLCGYNIKGFDLPIIIRRSWVLGVNPVKRFSDVRRYTVEPVVDLMELLYHGGYNFHYKSLKDVAKMYGIENSLPEAEGSQVVDMSLEQIADYCANDVQMTTQLALMMQGVYW